MLPINLAATGARMTRSRHMPTALVLACGALAVPGSAQAPPPAKADSNDLATKLANPVSSLISVPLQTNWDFGMGATGKGHRFTLNVQPVIPVSLNSDWNVVSRTIVPVIDQQDVTGPGQGQFGLGDTVQSLFFSPKKPGAAGIIWGAGPVFLLPTATDRALGGGKFGLGLTGVALKQSGPVTIGVLANHIWSVAGVANRADVSATLVNPFIAYVTPRATTFSISPEFMRDWTSKQWLIPLGVSVSQLLKIGNQPLTIGGGARYYVESPAGGPDWGIRASLVLLFPT